MKGIASQGGHEQWECSRHDPIANIGDEVSILLAELKAPPSPDMDRGTTGSRPITKEYSILRHVHQQGYASTGGWGVGREK